MAILFLVGKNKEPLDLVDTLLDVEKVPEKPIYSMASDKPLILSDCYFEGVVFKDTLKGYMDNYINAEEKVLQSCIEL